jgi:hypothetical protein
LEKWRWNVEGSRQMARDIQNWKRVVTWPPLQVQSIIQMKPSFELN